MPRQPNIVMIVADDVTPSYHGCYGGPTPTPQIDRLAREGLRVDRGYGCAALCCPSRWTLFTGQYASRARSCFEAAAPQDPALVSQNAMLDPETPTLAKALQAAGYLTAHVGKWHSRFATADFGFDEPKHCPGDADDPAIDAEIRRRHAHAQTVVRRCGGFELAERVNWGNLGSKGGIDPRLAQHNIAWMTDGALEVLDRAAAEARPFYLHLANTVPHSPDCNRSLGADHRYTWSGRLEQPPCSHPADETVLERLRAAGLQTEGPIAGVNAGMVQIDDQVGAVLAKLEALGLREDTIVIYTADHGIPGKGSCYITGQHLPLIVSWPAGLPQGRVIDDLVSWVDLVPTLLAACGARLPTEHRLDGHDLLPALRGEAPWPRASAYHEMGWSRSLLRGRYHYLAIRYPQAAIAAMQQDPPGAQPGIGLGFDALNAPFLPHYFEPDQLYDLERDPYERENLIDQPDLAPVLAELRAELQAIADTLPRPFPAAPDPFLETGRYRELLAARRAEMAAKQHYPPGDAPQIWHRNLPDPVAVG